MIGFSLDLGGLASQRSFSSPSAVAVGVDTRRQLDASWSPQCCWPWETQEWLLYAAFTLQISLRIHLKFIKIPFEDGQKTWKTREHVKITWNAENYLQVRASSAPPATQLAPSTRHPESPLQGSRRLSSQCRDLFNVKRSSSWTCQKRQQQIKKNNILLLSRLLKALLLLSQLYLLLYTSLYEYHWRYWIIAYELPFLEVFSLILSRLTQPLLRSLQLRTKARLQSKRIQRVFKVDVFLAFFRLCLS